jgi:hypothetical protein
MIFIASLTISVIEAYWKYVLRISAAFLTMIYGAAL